MEKSGILLGSILGLTIALLIVVFANPPQTGDISPEISESIVTDVFSETILEESSQEKDSTLTLVEIFEQSEAGVVRVNVQRELQIAGTTSVGSGFVYDLDGHIITNAHVIDDFNKIVVTFLDGRSYNAQLVGKDHFTDLAVIKVDSPQSLLKPLVVGDSSKLRVGEPIAAIGNPFGLSGSMTSGIVSQLGRLLPAEDSGFSIPNVIQTDATINPGNSGGPLLNMKGEVIGINTAIQSVIGEFTGVGFAVPSNTVTKIVPVLISDGEYHHPWMGISGRDIDPDLAKVLNLSDAKGFLIVTVIDDSPAAKAGLHGTKETRQIEGVSYPVGGDIILSVDGKDVRKIDDILIHLQREKSVGDEMVLKILRENRTTEIILLLEERPSN